MRFVLALTMVAVLGCSGGGDKPKTDGGTADSSSSDLPWSEQDIPQTDGPVVFTDVGQPDLPGPAPDNGPTPDGLPLDNGVAPGDLGPPPSNDKCSAPTVLTWSGSKITVQVDTTAALDDMDLGQNSCTGDITAGNDVFFKIQLPAGSFDVVLVPPASLDPALYLLSSCSASACVAGSDSIGSGAIEKVTVNPTSATTYIIGVDAWDPMEAGAYTLEVDVAAPTPDGGPLPDLGPLPDATIPVDAGPPPDAGPTPDQGATPTGKVVITEIMADPDAVADGKGEWFELHNPGTSAVSLLNWTIKDQGTDSHKITTNVTIPPGGYVVLGNNTDTGTNGGVTVTYTYGTSWYIANTADEIELYDAQMTLVDQVVYTGAWALPTGGTLSLKNPALDNNVAANWCAETAAWTPGGDKGTPGAKAGCGP
jgi:hypothetical protein